MNKHLLRVGGAVNLLFVLFHLAMARPMAEELAPLSTDIRATVSTLNIHVAFTLLIFAYFAIFQWRDLLATRLGNLLAVAISMFWFLRAINQMLVYELGAPDIPLLGLCVVVGLLHLLPVIRGDKNNAGEAGYQAEQHVDTASGSLQRLGAAPWPAYAAVAWCVVFGGLHLYWALGGAVGFADFSTPSARPLALARDPFYMAITWGVVIACVVAAVVALAPFQDWSRRLPRWLVLTPVWIACGLFFVRGFGNPIQAAVLAAGAMPFEHLSVSAARAWAQWTRLDLMYFSPWFILGGFAFGATARSACHHVDDVHALLLREGPQ